jgi:PGF-CTERM protein
MTKRITFALVAVALVILVTVMPVSAGPALYENGVIKGVVFIVADRGQDYYLGEEINLSGRNTATELTYLFITGPGLAVNGSQIQNRDPGNFPVENDNPVTFKQVGVNRDHTWSWKWNTAKYALEDGKYTIYALGQPNDKNHLELTPYGTTTITIRKPLVSTVIPIIATTSPPPPIMTSNKSPGYGALVALIGLGAVAFIVMRRY